MERVNGEIKRRTEVVGIFPNEPAEQREGEPVPELLLGLIVGERYGAAGRGRSARAAGGG